MENEYSTRTLAGAEIVVGKNVLDVIPSKIADVSKEGAIVVVYDKNVKDVANKVAENLRRLKRRIFLCLLDKMKEQEADLPDFIRYIVAVGCGYVCQRSDDLARHRNVPWSVVLTAPTTDTILRGKSPKHVFIDENVMINCPKRCIAAGYGIVYSLRLGQFESVFSNTVLATEKEARVPFEIRGDVTPVSLAVLLLEISELSFDGDSADCVAWILWHKAKAQGKTPLLFGEYKFLASCYLLRLYSHLLSSPSIDVALPPVKVQTREKLCELGCNNIVNINKNIDFFDINSYFKISYILQEYRTDLLEKLGSLNAQKCERVWRRIYDDAGYFLKSAITAKDLKEAVFLAGSVSDNLLGYAYASGILGH